MVHFRHVHRRDIQVPEISGTSTVDPAQATGTGLALDTQTNTHSQSAIPIAATPITFTQSTTPTTTSDDTQSTSDTSSSQDSSNDSSSTIPMSTVVGACVGALAGALLLILIGLWVYKRSAPKPRQRNPISSHAAFRNARGDADRSRSRMEAWDKLDEGEDTWEGQYQTKQISPRPDSVGPMEKLTMFKKSPSVRTVNTEKSYEAPIFDLEPHPFAQYHPNLAKEMATEPEPPLRPFLGRVDAGPALSWDSGNGSFHSLPSMSSETTIAIPTPSVTTSSVPHRWESAEVLHFDGETTQAVQDNPFLTNGERRKSASNPFFGAQSTLPRTSPRSSLKGSIKVNASDGSDPFADANVPDVPKLNQVAVSTTSSEATNERAIQSLIAALDFPEDRLRVTSMQPSVYSAISYYTEEEDVTEAFPLPPGAGK